jgi:sugar phosphate isomerase/epimerase
MKPIALQLWTVREEAKKDFVGTLKAIADIGYVGVEPAGLHGLSGDEGRKVLDDLGLVCCSTHGKLPDPAGEFFNARLEEAEALGTRDVVAGLGRKEFESEEARKAAFDKLQRTAEAVAAKGMRFGYHNHWWEMAEEDGELVYDRMLAAAPQMFGQLDVYWAANFGAVDVPALIRRHPGRFPSLHVKDGPLVQEEPHVAVGAGKMDIPPLIAAAEGDVLEWNIVELDHCGTDMMQAVRDSYAYLVGEGLAKGNK